MLMWETLFVFFIKLKQSICTQLHLKTMICSDCCYCLVIVMLFDFSALTELQSRQQLVEVFVSKKM